MRRRGTIRTSRIERAAEERKKRRASNGARRVAHSIRLSIRSLVRAPAFAVAATLTLALGIGLSTAVFTIADALLLRRLPVRDQDRVVTLWGEMRDGSLANVPLGITDTREFARRSRMLQSVAFFSYEGAWPTPIVDGDNITRLRRALVSGNYFEVLGIQPVLGRTLQPSDDVVGAAPVVVISYATWRRHFGGTENVIGKRITSQANGVAYSIVGVMPLGLEYPTGVELWIPLIPLSTVNDSTHAFLDLVGRLAPGATPASVQSELTAFLSRESSTARTLSVRGVVQTLPRVMLGDARPAVLVFAAAAALLLLITCINVANLLLVRGIARGREMAVRTALGATRIQVVSQLLIENAVLAIAGGTLGGVVGGVAVRSFLALAPSDVPLLGTVRVNMSVFAGALGITAITLLLFGLAPALVTARADLQQMLRSGTRQSASHGSRLVREALVAAQVALAVLVLSAAALIGRSFLKLQNADLAFDDSHLLIAELGLRYDRYDDAEKQLAMLRTLLLRLRATPGVRDVSPVLAVPFSGSGGWDGRGATDTQSPRDAATNPMFNMELVTPDYFEAVGLTVVRGRVLTEADRRGAEPVVVISETTARSYWPNQDPIGNRLLMGDKLDQAFTVVGVVRDSRYRDLRAPRASVYYALAQSVFPWVPTTLVIRATGSPAALVPSIRSVVSETVPGVVLANAAPFREYTAGPLAQPRLNAFLLSAFALAAVVLAAGGLAGIMATLVRQRTRELGVRMALGATARDIQSLVIGRGLVIIGAGMAVGLAGALFENRLLSALLYEVGPTDATTFAIVGALMFIVSLVATMIPAHASARIDPAIALRAEC